MDSPEEIAAAVKAKDALGLSGGMLVANPVPEEYSMDPDKIEAVISEAVEEAKAWELLAKKLRRFCLKKSAT